MITKACYTCEKVFIFNPTSIYKATVKGKVRHFCSYGCYRELQKAKEEKKASKLTT